MELRNLQIHHMPGIDTPFRIDGAPGLNLVLGPNGSGKSSLCRAALGLLWSEQAATGHVEANWADDATVWLATRAGGHRVTWQRDGHDAPPPELPSASQAGAFHLGLLDLLKLNADATDTALAGAVRRQLAGGYDLPRLLDSNVITGREGQKHARDLVVLTANARNLARMRQDLETRENALDSLQSQHAAADGATVALAALQNAEEIGRARREVQAHEDHLSSTYPPHMDLLRVSDAERLDELRGRQREATGECDEAGRDFAQAQTDAEATGFVEAYPEKHRLDAVADLLTRASGFQDERDTAEVELKAADTALQVAAAALAPWGLPETDEPVDASRLREEASRIHDILRRTAERDGLQDLLKHPDLDIPDDPPDEPGAFVEGREALSNWLLARDERRWPIQTLVIGAAVVAAGVVLAPWSGPWPAWIVLGGGAVLLATPLLRLARRRKTRDALAAYRRTGLAEPPTWADDTVGRHLSDLVDSEAAASRHRLLREYRDRLDAELARASEALQTETPPTEPAAALNAAERLHRNAAYHEALRLRAAARHRHETMVEKLGRMLEEVAHELSDWVDDPGNDAATLRFQLDGLRQRRDDHATAVAKSMAAEQRRTDANARLDSARSDAESLLTRHDLGPQDDEEFHGRIAMLAAFQRDQAAMEDTRTRQRLHEEARSGLTATQQTIAANTDGFEADALAAAIESAETTAARLTDLGEEIARTTDRLKQAAGDDSLDTAIRELHAATSELCDERSKVRNTALRRLLLERLQRQHRQTTEPPVLARARDLLRTFTNGVYDLTVSPSEDEGFRALDTRTGRGLSLSQLSDGTRAQLLLAARLASLTSAERGVRVPLFLDESLTASDPNRFAAIAGAILDLVQSEQRQVFYLTCDPADIASWQEQLIERGLSAAPVIDLVEIRRLAAAAPTARLRADSLTPPPAPAADEDPAEYGRRVDAPPLDPQAPAAGAHLLYLLRDDLTTLHGLLTRRVTRLGQCEALGDPLTRDGALDTDSLARLQARGRTLTAFLDAFGVGRGRSIPRGAIQNDSGISTSKLGAIEDAAAEVHGRARELVEALDRGRVPRLRADIREQLADWLQSNGYLDERSRLELADVAEQVILAVRGDISEQHISMATVQSLVAAWWVAAGGD